MYWKWPHCARGAHVHQDSWHTSAADSQPGLLREKLTLDPAASSGVSLPLFLVYTFVRITHPAAFGEAENNCGPRKLISTSQNCTRASLMYCWSHGQALVRQNKALETGENSAKALLFAAVVFAHAEISGIRPFLANQLCIIHWRLQRPKLATGAVATCIDRVFSLLRDNRFH